VNLQNIKRKHCSYNGSVVSNGICKETIKFSYIELVKTILCTAVTLSIHRLSRQIIFPWVVTAAKLSTCNILHINFMKSLSSVHMTETTDSNCITSVLQAKYTTLRYTVLALSEDVLRLQAWSHNTHNIPQGGKGTVELEQCHMASLTMAPVPHVQSGCLNIRVIVHLH
jgi:hypothetical protein